MTEDEVRALNFLRSGIPEGQGPSGDEVRRSCAALVDAPPGEVLAPLLVCFWFAKGSARQCLGTLVLRLATRLPVSLWPRVDERARHYWPYGIRSESGEDLADDAASVLVASCHPSGRIRERATTMVAVLPPLLAAKLLLVRANDWVRPVLRLARAGLEPALAGLTPAEKMQVAPLVARLWDCSRFFRVFPPRRKDETPQASDVERWFDQLASSFEPSEWLKLWNSADGPEQRVYLDLLKRSHKIPGAEIRTALFSGNNRSAVIWYLQDVLPYLDGTERMDALEAIMRFRAVPVRKLWLAQQIETDPPTATTELVRLLTDRSRSLREFARYHLARMAPMDFPSHYGAMLRDSSIEPWALRGLAEVSPTAGHREALLRLDSPDARVRRAAIECLEAETLEDHLDILIREIQTSGTGPAKAARKRLGSITPSLGALLVAEPERLSAMTPGAQKYLLSLAPFFRKWDGLELLLRAAADLALHQLAEEFLQTWLSREGRAFIRLPSRKREEFRAMVKAAKLRNANVAAKVRYVVEHAEN